MSKADNKYSSLIKKLHVFRQKSKRSTLYNGIVKWFIAFITILFLCLTIEAIFRFSTQIRTVIVFCGFLIIAIAGTVWIILPLLNLLIRRNIPDDVKIALKVGRNFEDIEDRLANALQLFYKKRKNTEKYSEQLIDTSLQVIAERMTNEDFSRLISYRNTIKLLRISTALAVFFLIIVSIFYNPYNTAAVHLLHFSTDYIIKPSIVIDVYPGNVEIVKGDEVTISAKIRGGGPNAHISLRKAGSEFYIEHEMGTVGADSFLYAISDVRDSTYYYVHSNEASSSEHLISVISLPMIRALRVTIQPPEYCGLPNQILDENIGDVIALKGSTIKINATANKPLHRAELVLSKDRTVPLRISGRVISGIFNVLQNSSYSFSLIDKNGRENTRPMEYRVTALPDRAPIVSIPLPGKDVDIGEDMTLPMIIEGEDDFGFSKARLGFQLQRDGDPSHRPEMQYTALKFIDKRDLLRIEYLWDLSELNLIPEDIVVYHAEVFDNDMVSGPKSSKSISYRVRFPSMYEIYQEVAETQEQTFETLETVYSETKQLKERIDQFVQQMKKDPELDWGEKKEIEEALQTQRKLQEEMQKASQDLDEIIDRMEQNDLVSLETLEKYMELQRLFAEIASPEMQEAMQKLQMALSEVDPQKLKEAVEKFDLSQEDFLENIERTIALLQRLQIQQKLDEAVRKSSDLALEQDEMEKKLSDSTNDPDALADEQRKLGEDARELRSELGELQEMMSQFADMPQQEIATAESIMDSLGIHDQMDSVASMIQKQNISGAQKMASKATSGLQQVSQTLQAAQKQMSENEKREIRLALQKITHNLLRLSHSQEALMNETHESQPNTSQMNDFAKTQQNLKEGLNRVSSAVYALSQKTFHITPQIGAAVGSAQGHMNRALEQLSNGRAPSSTNHQADATQALNNAVKQIMQSLQNLSSGGSGLGYESFLQRLQSSAEAQQGINQQTMGIGPGGQYSLEQMAAMARLAAEQGALREALESLQQEMGQRSDIPGRLDQVLRDMEDVQDDLKAKKIDRRTIDRQRRILSRLLDAQRSVRERDYSRKRQARAGENILGQTPGALPLDLGERPNQLQEDLLRARKEGYTHDYLELIKQYFEALARAERESTYNNN